MAEKALPGFSWLVNLCTCVHVYSVYMLKLHPVALPAQGTTMLSALPASDSLRRTVSPTLYLWSRESVCPVLCSKVEQLLSAMLCKLSSSRSVVEKLQTPPFSLRPVLLRPKALIAPSPSAASLLPPGIHCCSAAGFAPSESRTLVGWFAFSLQFGTRGLESQLGNGGSKISSGWL